MYNTKMYTTWDGMYNIQHEATYDNVQHEAT